MLIDLATINFCPGQGGGKPAVVEELSVTANGVYTPGTGVDGFNPVTVDVQPVLEQKTITENGKYVPEEGTDGWNEIDVEVPQKEEIDLNWHIIDNGQITFNAPDGKTYKKVVMDVDVPQEVEGVSEKEVVEGVFTMTSLNNSASFVLSSVFSGNKTIQTVNLPKCVSVGTSAFFRGNVNYANLPECRYIGGAAFYNHYQLSEVNGSNFRSIGLQAFQSCSNLQSINLDNTYYIGLGAFSDCKSLSGNINTGAYNLYENTFINTKIQNISASNCIFISNSAFANCYSLQSAYLPNVVVISAYAFYSCSSLQGIYLPNVVSIGERAFWVCSSLSYVSVPNLVYINSAAFYNCRNLQSIDLPVCYSISNGVFNNCNNLREVKLGFNGYKPISIRYDFTALPSLSSIYVPNFMVDMYKASYPAYSNKFVGYDNGHSMDDLFSLSDGVLTGYAMNFDSGFSSFVSDYSNIRVLNLPNCVSYDSVNIGNVEEATIGIKYFVDYRSIFANLASVRVLNLPELRWYLAAVGLGFAASYLETFNAPKYVSGTITFGNKSALKNVNMPMLASVGGGMFSNCSNLESVNVENCSFIGSYAFRSCSKLTSINLPNCLSISMYAFTNCNSLQFVNIPNVEYISSHVFEECNSLLSVNMPNADYIGYRAFYRCSSLGTASLPNATIIEEGAFNGCGLSELYSPNVVNISPRAFDACLSLETINLPNVTSIGMQAFANCQKLSKVTIGTNVSYVVPINDGIFNWGPIQFSTYLGYYGSIYVPASLVDAYKSATNWVAYSDRITAIPE